MTEPITTLTDYAIALETALFAICLLRFNRIERFWAAAFICVSLASLLGGTYHGFAAQIPYPVQRGLWAVLTYAMGICSFLILVATAQATVKPKLQRWITLLAATKLLTYLYAITLRLDFAYVVADYLLAMLLILGLHLGWGLPQRQTGSHWMVAGVGVSALAVGILALPKAGFGAFSPVDIYHIVQMAALSCFFLGVYRSANPVWGALPPD
ncbi:hypothetical protein [Pseudanabaena sp. FACHB-2040]|uniref:DUF6962 family protein n=1 Tax=Pseudanabaena sp. FACHB-2040 TaxID=2692859 RepID=UPI0016851F95|nr:hypothetical protein [Pseudanabaena sp. FACHB-2040]MBD2259613.1 hypothetical protein [Pseudanabaena sp. FACHB-2040]